MSYGPVTPSLDELLHQLVSMAIHRGGWVYLDGIVAGAPYASWPTPEEAPPAGLALGDVVALRPIAAHNAGAKDAIYFKYGAVTIDVAISRVGGGFSEAWDTGTHVPAAGASVIGPTPVSIQLAATYGDVFVVDDYGLGYVQIASAGTFGRRLYWGYFDSAARNPDGTGAALGEEPEPFPLGAGELDYALTASTLMEMEAYVEGDALVTFEMEESIFSAREPTRAGESLPTIQLSPLHPSGGVGPVGTRGRIPSLFAATISGPPNTTLTQVRDPTTGDRYLVTGHPSLVSFGPLAPRGNVFYRIVTYGGPVVS